MRTVLLSLLVLSIAGCQLGDASDGAAEAEADSARTGAPIASRAETITLVSLTEGPRWCRLRYRTADGEEIEADGLRSMCSLEELVGRSIELSFVTYDIEDEEGGVGKEVVSGIRADDAAPADPPDA